MDYNLANHSKFNLGDKETHANRLRANGQGVGNQPGYNRGYGLGVTDNSGNLKKYDKMGPIVGE